MSRVLVGFLLIGGLASTGCVRLRARRVEAPPQSVTMNSPLDAHWTSTTLDAAANPRYRKLLEQARPKTVVGEVVDVSCFLQLGKRGEAHVPCGQKCVRNGQPMGVLTDHGHLYLILPEEHDPRRDGQVSIKERFAELMAKRVRVSGMLTAYNGYLALFVRTLPTQQ